MKRLLIVDDDVGTRESLRMIFSSDYSITLTASAEEALGVLAAQSVDLILLDVLMPEKDGVTLLKELTALYPETPVIMISASTNARPIVESMKSGAVDFVTKPFDVKELRHLVKRSLEHYTLRQRVKAMESDMQRLYPEEGLIGESPAFQYALQNARRAAQTDATVLIHGESGTGKEMIARQIHTWSERAQEPFVAVHCASIPETLMESELFGHEKGAFTNASKQKLGRFDLAGSGTLFFDEVGEMSLSTQVKLLRVLQEREYMRLGGNRVLHTNARILAATNRDLLEQVRKGDFREDLYYRLNVVPIEIPPLRKRLDDVGLLATHFLEQFRTNLNAHTREFEPEALEALQTYEWPGNIRELRNVIERSVVLHGHHARLPRHLLPNEFQDPSSPQVISPNTLKENLSASVEQVERELLIEALRACDGVQTRAAKMLGTTRRILKYKMDKHQITLPLEEEDE